MNYWIAIDKPRGVTSNFIVQKVKRILKPKKIGHGGTLDPFATGVLPIALGEATKTSQFIINQEKSYEFEMQFGAQTDTDDIDGKIIAQSDLLVDESAICVKLGRFIGEIEQLPPKFSAKKINGVRAYKLARAEQEVLLKPCKVFVKDFSLIDFDLAKQRARFIVEVGKGTYIRSLARDLGEVLGCYGYVKSLRRKKLGHFNESLLISVDDLEKIVYNNELNDHIFSLDFVLVDIPAIEINSVQKEKIRYGCSILVGSVINGQVRLINQGDLIAIGDLNEGIFSISRVFNNFNPNE